MAGQQCLPVIRPFWVSYAGLLLLLPLHLVHWLAPQLSVATYGTSLEDHPSVSSVGSLGPAEPVSQLPDSLRAQRKQNLFGLQSTKAEAVM